MGQVLTLAVQLQSVDCGECGGVYAINERYHQKCAQEGKSWTCPYCNVGWGFENRGENARLKAELEAEKVRKVRALAEANEQRSRAIRAEESRERLKRRVKAGACPCCKRSFVALARHIANKHPEFSK